MLKTNDSRGRRRLPRRSIRGAGLIEVLVAVLVLSIGLLGIAGLQTRGMKNNQSALERSQAVMLSYAAFDAMRANVQAARAGDYELAKTCSAGSGGSLVEEEQKAWLEAIKAALGDLDTTCGEIDCDGNICTVRVYWEDRNLSGTGSAQMIETSSQL